MNKIVDEMKESVKKFENNLDNMSADQMKAVAVNMCVEYHRVLKEMNLTEEEKRIILNMAHNNQMFEIMLIRRLEKFGFFNKKR